MSRVDDIISSIGNNGTEKKKSRVESIIENSSNGNLKTGVDKNYINSFAKDTNDFLSNFNNDLKDIGFNNASSYYDTFVSKSGELAKRAKTIQAYLNSNKNNLDEETYNSLMDSLNSFYRTRDSIVYQLGSTSQYYSQWDTEDEYKEYQKQQEEYEALLKFDTKTGAEELRLLESDLEGIKATENQIAKIKQEQQILELAKAKGSRDAIAKFKENEKLIATYNKNLEDAYAKYGGKDGLESLISQKNQYLTSASRAQKAVELASVAENEDFEKNSKYIGLDMEDISAEEDLLYMYINGNENVNSTKNDPKFESYRYINDDQKKIYNYYYNTGNKKMAQEYLDAIQEKLNYQQAEAEFKSYEGKLLSELVFGISAGLDQFESGMEAWFSGEDYIPTSPTQYLSGMIREDLGDDGVKLPDWLGGSSLGQVGYDAITTTSNMLPSILTSAVVEAALPTAGEGGIVLSATMAKTIGKGVGAATLGASAGGNGRAEMLRLGYSKEQANAYGVMVGAAEAGMEYLLGNIPGLSKGDGIFSTLGAKAVSKVDNALARVATTIGGSLDEALEEGLQTIIEPWLKEIATGVDWDDPSIDEVLYSSLLGAITSAGFQVGTGAINLGANAIHKNQQTKAHGQAIIDKGGVDTLKELALEMSGASKKTTNLANKVGQNASAKNVGRLSAHLEESISKQNRTDIENALVEKGLSKKDAKMAAEYVADSGKLTAEQEARIESSDYFQKAIDAVLEDSNTNVSTNSLKLAEARIGNKSTTASDDSAQPHKTEKASVNASEKEIVTESKFEASADGKTRIGETEVSIKEIASVKNGEMILRLEDGSTVNASEVEYGSNAEGLLYENVVHMGFNAATANAFVNGYDGNLPVAEYALDFRQAYRYGELGIPKSEMSSEGFSSSLTEAQKSLAYDLGMTDAKYKTESKKASATRSKTEQVRKGKLHNTLTPTNETQRASLKTLGVIAEALGIDIYTFESPLINGKRQGANGWYDAKTNSIHIDLFAGAEGKGTMLFTAAHELTHHIREKLPAKFKVFADFLFEQYGEKGISVSELIENKRAFLEQKGRITPNMTEAEAYDLAYEEVVADACESFLADGNAVAKIAELKAKDKTLWQTIKDFLTKLVERIKAAYEGLSPDSVEGRYVAEMLDTAEQLKAMWTEMLVEASEVSDLVEIDSDTESVSPMFSERTWTASEYVTEREETAKKISEALGVDIKTAYKYIDDINGIARLIADDRARLDYEPNLDEKATVLKPNSEYKFSVDMSTLCAKRLLFTGTFDAIQKALPNMVFDSEDIVSLREIMQKRGYEVACGICYVESTRREIGRITQEFIDRYKVAQQTGRPISRINSSGKEVILKSAGRTFSADKNYTPNLGELNTTDIDIVKRDHREVYDAYLAFMNARGQAKPKLLETRAEYKGEILKHFKAKSSVEARNNAGGLRLQSFSDFEVPHMIDMMQIVMDMSRVGLKSQAYTKVPAFAEIFGDTGVKINLSLIAKGDGLDANGNLIFDDVEGINHKEAFKLRDKYSKNVGTILVGKTDAHIIAAMADPRIDYIIPFHKSSWKESLYDALGLMGYADYTDYQNEKPIDKDRKIKNFDPSEYWDFTKSGDENAQIYLEKCREDGRIPKFPQFQGYPGYWKLLIDFKMYDNDGIGSPQEVVKPVFNTEASDRILGEYKGGHKSFPVAKDVVEDFVKEHKDKVKYSERGYGAIREAFAKKGLDELSKKMGSYFPLSASFDSTMLADNTPLIMTTVAKNGVERVKGKSDYAIGNEAFKKAYGSKTKVHIKQMGIDAELYRDVAKESINKATNRSTLQATMDVIPHLSDILENSKLFALERINHTSNKGTALFGYRLYNLYWYEETINKVEDGKTTQVKEKTPHCLVCTVVQNAEKAEGYVFRDIENVTINHSLPTSKSDMSESVNDDGYTISQLYRFVKGLNREKGGIKYTPDEKAVYGFHYTKRDDGKLYSDRTSYAPTFYSYMGKVIEDIKLEKMGTSSILNHLKNRGVKNDEIKWSGIEAFLEGKKSVTKAELQEFLAGSQLQIEEQISGDDIDLRYDGSNCAYTLHDSNGEVIDTFTYNEFMDVYVAESDEEIYSNGIELKEALRDIYGKNSSPKWAEYKLDGGSNYRELVFVIPNSSYSNIAMRAHWGQDVEGVLAHARIQDMTTSDGKKMLFIEEIQSDWHNAGQKYGYDDKGNGELNVARRRYRELGEESDRLWDGLRKYDVSKLSSEEKQSIANDFMERDRAIGEEREALKNKYGRDVYMDAETIPDAPFHNNYHEYVLKRLIRMAAEEGYESIGWTTADIQSERWSDEFAEGYRIEYDQDIPSFLKKYGKKWGATVGKTSVSGDIEIWSMDITKSMGQSVLYEGQVMYQDRDTASVSNRSLLANALETTAQNDIEKNKLAQYKEKISLIESEQAKLSEIRAKIKELSFAKGARDTEAIKKLKFEANQTANRINTYDRQLLNLESTKALKDVLEREKQMAFKRAEQRGREALKMQREKDRERNAKTQRELMNRYQESRKKGIEGRNKTEMRHKIKDVVNELNQYLTKGTKDKHVPIELQKAVAEALNAVNMDTVSAEERIAKKRAEMMKAKSPEVVERLAKEIEHIQEMGGNMAKKISRLKTAYDSIINSDDPLVANSHDEVISNSIERVMEVVGDTPLRDMSLYQLEAVYDMYKMVLTTIRNANKAFKTQKSEEISVIANRVMEEIDKLGKKKLLETKAGQLASRFDWNNLKPVYAFERIGSDTFTEVFNNVRAGEDTWAVDITEAKEFSEAQHSKFNYASWDFSKRFGFTSTSGMHFELSLEQIMSLYAYSKREQAKEHLKRGGIVFDETTEVTVKTKLGIPVKFNPTQATAYNISDETLVNIIGKLTAEQREFVDVMQDYLSTTMGEKGNEVSLALYGVKLYKEKNYFPLKSATQFMAKAKEQQKGEVKIKNSGFSKETTPKASNPIVLTPFMDVWASHVNEMSMYHAFVLPLEDFYRVFNYKTPTSDTMATESVEMFLQNAYGKAATQYIDQLLKDLNGGARVDSTVGVINKLTSLFKKSAVFASASVVIQQPSAIARATALVDSKYFVGKPAKGKHKDTWAEVKKYAPVAIIKEMGYFDTGMGQSTVEWLKGEKTLGDKIDDIASKAPALADEFAWCAIWNAVKRETLHTQPKLRPNSEEFLKAVGERFTEVITKTQVYDSVLARSGNMRSKDTGMKMATAFMAEPTTSLNMLANALIQGKRGNIRYARKAIGSVVASMILNSILVSIVYAGRDDDEDKTYAEKYIGTFTEELLDSLNPLTLVPFVKDIVSIVQGYDVERSDMAVITDLVNAWNNLDSDNRSVYRKVEDFGGAIASLFGLPVKNIMRDVRGMYNTINSFINGEKTTGAGIKDAVTEAVTGESKTNGQQLYEAIVSGDSAQIERVMGRFENQDDANSAFRKVLKEKYQSGEVSRSEAIDLLINYGGYDEDFDEDDAYWRLEEWDFGIESEDDYSKYADFYEAVKTGKNIKAVIREYTDHGVEAKTLASQITKYYKPLYKEMTNAERARIKGYLLNAYELLGYDRSKKSKDIDKWLED